ncbi:MAG: flavodoxin family protein [Deltaproteobacteria bacterium]|nr:flavodoxin family protein [Deltaproteobacteria bacterium]
MPKVVAFNGSPNREGNTGFMIRQLFDSLSAEGIDTEMIQLADKKIRGCKACFKCMENANKKCAINDDVNDCIEKMIEADAIVLGTPTYFADVSTEIKALIDRAGLVAKANGELFRRKLGAAVVAVRRAGSVHAFDSINHFFLIGQMIIPGSCYWNMGIGRGQGEVTEDEEGMRTMKVLGENMSWLLKKMD